VKAIVQFEIIEPELTQAEVKIKLIEHMVETMDLWIHGKGIITIEFVETYEKTNERTDIPCN
jgi:hypothetical protein